MHIRRRTVVAVAATAAAAAVVVSFWAQRERTHELATSPSTVAEAREADYFDDVQSLATAADLVVVGTVTGINPGRVVGPPDEGDQIRFRAVRVRVDRVLRGSVAAGRGKSITIEEEGWTVDDGKGYLVNGVAWSERGDTGVYFLHLKTDPGPPRYRLVASTGRVLAHGHGVEASGNSGVGGDRGEHSDAPTTGPWAQVDLSTMKVADVEALVLRGIR